MNKLVEPCVPNAVAEWFHQRDDELWCERVTNHNLAVLRTMQSFGAGVDVVSLAELHRARLADFKGRDIAFGGVGKRRDEIDAALAARVLLFNVESEAQLRLIEELAAARAVQAPVALRVNPK
jgi:diaminopimelate decarboxylase